MAAQTAAVGIGREEVEAGLQLNADPDKACVPIHSQAARVAQVVGVQRIDNSGSVVTQSGEIITIAESGGEVRFQFAHADGVELDIQGQLGADAFQP